MNNKPSQLQRTDLGFSVAEVIVAAALATILLTIIVGFMIESNRTSFFLTEQSDAVMTADKTTALLSQQLRETTDGDDGSYALAEATTTSVAFHSDIDADDVTEYIRYELVGTDIVRTVIEPTSVPATYLPADAVTDTVAHNIVNVTFSGNPVFTYFDATNLEQAEPIELGTTTLVKIHLDVNINPQRIPDTHTIETYVQLRNLNNNL